MAEGDLLRHAAGQGDDQRVHGLLLGHVEALDLFGRLRVTEGRAVRDDRDLVEDLAAEDVARLVVGGAQLLGLVHDERVLVADDGARQAHVEVLGRGGAAPILGGVEGGLVDEVHHEGAAAARRALGHLLQVDVRRQRDVAGMDHRLGLAADHVRWVHLHLAVEASRAQQRRVQGVRAVGGADQQDAGLGGEAVHLHEQLVERLLPLVIAAGAAVAASLADGVDLVDEDDGAPGRLGLGEEIADAGGAHAHEHLDEVGARDREERHVRLAGERARDRRLARAGRTDEQETLRHLAAARLELQGIAQVVHDLVHRAHGVLYTGQVAEAGVAARGLLHVGLEHPRGILLGLVVFRLGAVLGPLAVHEPAREEGTGDGEDDEAEEHEHHARAARLGVGGLLGLQERLRLDGVGDAHHRILRRDDDGRDGLLGGGLGLHGGGLRGGLGGLSDRHDVGKVDAAVPGHSLGELRLLGVLRVGDADRNAAAEEDAQDAHHGRDGGDFLGLGLDPFPTRGRRGRWLLRDDEGALRAGIDAELPERPVGHEMDRIVGVGQGALQGRDRLLAIGLLTGSAVAQGEGQLAAGIPVLLLDQGPRQDARGLVPGVLGDDAAGVDADLDAGIRGIAEATLGFRQAGGMIVEKPIAQLADLLGGGLGDFDLGGGPARGVGGRAREPQDGLAGLGGFSFNIGGHRGGRGESGLGVNQDAVDALAGEPRRLGDAGGPAARLRSRARRGRVVSGGLGLDPRRRRGGVVGGDEPVRGLQSRPLRPERRRDLQSGEAHVDPGCGGRRAALRRDPRGLERARLRRDRRTEDEGQGPDRERGGAHAPVWRRSRRRFRSDGPRWSAVGGLTALGPIGLGKSP